MLENKDTKMIIEEYPNDGWHIEGNYILPPNSFRTEYEWLQYLYSEYPAETLRDLLENLHTQKEFNNFINDAIKAFNNMCDDLSPDLFKI